MIHHFLLDANLPAKFYIRNVWKRQLIVVILSSVICVSGMFSVKLRAIFSMKQLLVDMDGVLADVYSQFLRLEREETGVSLAPESLHGKLEAEAFPHYEQHVHSKDFFRMAPVMPGSIEGLRYLNDKYKVVVVSSAMEFPDSLFEKRMWMAEFYPFISWTQLVFCGDKSVIRGEIMIDDHPKNLNHFPGRKILFTQPHNLLLPDHTWQRVSNWKELLRIL